MKHTIKVVDENGTEFFAGEFRPCVTSSGWIVSSEAWSQLYDAYRNHFGTMGEHDIVGHATVKKLSYQHDRAAKQITEVMQIRLCSNQRMSQTSCDYYEVPGSVRFVTLTLVEDYS